MKFRKLSASFGRLSGESLELSGGLNIVEAPNESGKSTWCAFIRAILYGIDTSARDKAGKLADKTRYRPWSGVPMEGSAEIETGGRVMTIQRTGNARSPMKDFAAMYADTGETVPGITGADAGEKLTGVPSQVFERSVFIGQAAMRIGQTPELEKRIAALAASGDEDYSFSEAMDRLKVWQRRRKYRQSGAVPALESRISELEDAEREIGRIGLEAAEHYRRMIAT